MRKLILTLFSVFITLGIIISTFSPSDSKSRTTSPSARSGGPVGGPDGGNSCYACHTGYGGAFTRAGWITSDIPGNAYVPGATYNITVTVNSPGYKHGFEASCQTTTACAGTLIANDTTQIIYAGSNSWISHMDSTRALQHEPQILPCQKGYKGAVHNQNLKSWTFQWIAPAAGTGAVSFYASMVAANGNGSDNSALVPPGTWAWDSVFTSSLALTENTSAYFSSVVKPCNGASNGSATINAGFGTGPYTYLWNPSGQTTSAATGLAEGNHSVLVTDALSASMTLNLTLQNNVTALLNDQNTPTCPGGVATHTVLATGGTTPYTYLWSDAQNQTTQAATGLAVGQYTVAVSDAAACTTTYLFNATDKPAMHVWFYDWQDKNVSLNGGNDGYAKVQREYNSTPYTYTWSTTPVQTTQTATGLTAGTYSVAVSGAGCPSNTGSATVTITEPAPASVTASNYFSTSGLTQKVDTLPAGGIVPGNTGMGQTYNFSALHSHLTSTSAYIAPASGVKGSSYSMSSVCMHQDTMYLYLDSSSTKLDMWGVAGNLLQNGVNNALVYSNPQTVLTFPSVYNTNFKDTANYDSKFAYMGYYQGFWVDSLRKKETIITTSTIDGAGKVITPNRTYTSCLRQNVLKHSVDSTWAKIVVGSFHYWINLTGDTSNTRSYSYITDSVAGPVVNIQYYPDSSAIYQVRWNSLTLSATTAQTNITCNGDNNGTASVTVSGGTLPYTYAWTPSGGTTATATGLSAGNYTVTVTDAASATTTAALTITEPAALTATVSASTNVLCYGNNTGSATATSGGGTTPYTYSWNSTPAQATATATGLVAGNYTATVTDANGCIKTTTVTITEPSAAVTVSVTAATNVLCKGLSTGDATASGSGGTGSIGYTWNTSPAQNTATATGLTAGIIYQVTATDANSCVSTASVIITEPAAALSAPLTSLVHVFCRGNSTGSAGVTASGGTSPYTYSWNSTPAQTTATATGLAAGNYTATVTDANGCSKVVTVTITQPATAVSATVTASANVNCSGGTDGSATASGSGGTGALGYVWNTTPAQSTALATGLIAGDYQVTATDTKGCAATATVTITEPATAVSATVTASANVSCNGGNNGDATASASGGTGTPAYSWNSTPAQTTATATGLTAGDYVVTATDANGCASTASVTITEPTAVTASVTATTNATCGNSNGDATVTASGGTSTFSYSWNSAPVQTTATATGLSVGSYTVDVTDANGCSATATANILNPGAPTVSVTATTDVTCNGGSNGDVTATASGTGTLTYSWNTTPVQTTLTATGLSAGAYDLTVTDGVGCITIQPATINEPTAVTATVTTTAVSCNGGNNGDATVAASGGTGTPTYSWNTTPAQTTATATGLTAADYVVTATDANGCAATATVTVTEPTAVTATVTTTAVSCNGGNNGDATVAASGGTGTPAYSWNTTPAQTTATATGLTAADYVVTATDANGCAATATVTVAEPVAALTATATITTPICGNSDGSATAIPSGGTGIYTYSWNTTPVQITATVTGLNPNPTQTVIVTITDANGCQLVYTAVDSCVTGVVENKVESNLNVYPNPNLGEFNIELNSAASNDYTIELSNVLGQVMYSETLANFSGRYTKHFDMKKYGEGIYFMSIYNKTGLVKSTKIAVIQ